MTSIRSPDPTPYFEKALGEPLLEFSWDYMRRAIKQAPKGEQEAVRKQALSTLFHYGRVNHVSIEDLPRLVNYSSQVEPSDSSWACKRVLAFLYEEMTRRGIQPEQPSAASAYFSAAAKVAVGGFSMQALHPHYLKQLLPSLEEGHAHEQYEERELTQIDSFERFCLALSKDSSKRRAENRLAARNLAYRVRLDSGKQTRQILKERDAALDALRGFSEKLITDRTLWTDSIRSVIHFASLSNAPMGAQIRTLLVFFEQVGAGHAATEGIVTLLKQLGKRRRLDLTALTLLFEEKEALLREVMGSPRTRILVLTLFKHLLDGVAHPKMLTCGDQAKGAKEKAVIALFIKMLPDPDLMRPVLALFAERYPQLQAEYLRELWSGVLAAPERDGAAIACMLAEHDKDPTRMALVQRNIIELCHKGGRLCSPVRLQALLGVLRQVGRKLQNRPNLHPLLRAFKGDYSLEAIEASLEVNFLLTGDAILAVHGPGSGFIQEAGALALRHRFLRAAATQLDMRARRGEGAGSRKYGPLAVIWLRKLATFRSLSNELCEEAYVAVKRIAAHEDGEVTQEIEKIWEESDRGEWVFA